MGRPATLKVDITADAKGVGRGVDQAESRLSRLGNVAKKVGKVAAAGLAAVAIGAAGLAVASIKSASDVEQSFGAVESVFGKNAGAVKKWAGQAASSVGLAKSEYAGLATVVGSQLQNMGRSQGDAAKQSDALIRKGADLAATFGGSVSDAVGAVSSLLKGERDPIERYGVSIKQADINARLAEQGLAGLTGKAKAQAEATATLDILTQQTAKTHGAFSRESGTLAGQQERLRANFENVKATIGAKLLPVATRLFTWFNDKLLPGAARLGGQLRTQLGPAITRVGAFITGTLVPAASKIYTWFVAKIVPAIKSYVMPQLAGLRSAFGSISSSVSGNSANLQKLGRFLGTVIPPVARVMAKVMGGTLGNAFKALGTIIAGVITTIARLVGWISTAVEKVKALASAIKNSPVGKVAGAIGGLFGSTPVVGMTPGALGGSRPSGPGVGHLATASAAGDLGLSAGARRLLSVSSGVTYVDRRSYTFDIPGVIVDKVGTARAIRRLLDEHDTRTGARPAFGAA